MTSKLVHLVRLVIWWTHLWVSLRLANVLRPNDVHDLIVEDSTLPTTGAPQTQTPPPTGSTLITGSAFDALLRGLGRVNRWFTLQSRIFLCSLGAVILGPATLAITGYAGGIEPSTANRISGWIFGTFVAVLFMNVLLPLAPSLRLKPLIQAVDPDWPSGQLEVGDLLTVLVTAILILSPYAGRSALADLGIVLGGGIGIVGLLFILYGLYRFLSAVIYVSFPNRRRLTKVGVTAGSPSTILAILLAQTAITERFPLWEGTHFAGLWQVGILLALLISAILLAIVISNPKSARKASKTP